MKAKLQNILTVLLLCLANLTVFGQSSTKAEFTVDVKPTGNGWEVTSQKFEVVVIPAYERSGAKYIPKGSTVNVIPVSENKQNLVKQIRYNGQTINVPPDYKNTINANASFFSGSIRSMTITVSINGSYYTKELEIYGNRKFDISINVPAGEKPNFSIGGFQVLDVKFDDKKVKAVVDGINVFNSTKDEKAKKELDDKIAEGKRERETSAGSTQNTNNSYRYNNVSTTQQKIVTIDKAHSEFNNAIDQVSESLRKESREHQQKSAAIWEDVLATEATIKQSELEFEKREKERKEKKQEEYKKIEQDEKKRLDITLNKREFGKYDEISEFSKEGLALVAVGSKTLKKYGYVNKNGDEVITLQYDWADNFKNGLAAVVLNGKGGFIDQNGKEVIPLKYDYVKSFSDGLALVNTGSTWLHGGHLVPKGKSGFIDKSGKEVIPLRYDYAEPFSEGLALVLIGDVTKLKGKWAFIDTTEDEVIPLKYNLAKSFSEGLAPVNIGFTLGENFNSGKWGYIDKNGNEVIPVKYDEVSLFSEGLARVKLKGRYGFINKKGQEVIPIILEYMSISDFSEGLAKIQKGSFPNYKYGFIDSTGKEIGTLEYDYAESFKNGKAKVKLDGREFYIDKTGKEVK